MASLYSRQLRLCIRRKKDWPDFASGTGGWRIGYKVEIIDFGASTADSSKLFTHSKVEYTSSGYVGSEMAVLEFADCKGVRAQIYVSDNDSPIAKFQHLQMNAGPTA